MNIQEALDFIKKAKQPAAYFDDKEERYRFQNVAYENDKTIYKYLNESRNIEISIKR